MAKLFIALFFLVFLVLDIREYKRFKNKVRARAFIVVEALAIVGSVAWWFTTR